MVMPVIVPVHEAGTIEQSILLFLSDLIKQFRFQTQKLDELLLVGLWQRLRRFSRRLIVWRVTPSFSANCPWLKLHRRRINDSPFMWSPPCVCSNHLHLGIPGEVFGDFRHIDLGVIGSKEVVSEDSTEGLLGHVLHHGAGTLG